jgi:hypothetical protein
MNEGVPHSAPLQGPWSLSARLPLRSQVPQDQPNKPIYCRIAEEVAALSPVMSAPMSLPSVPAFLNGLDGAKA